MPPTRTADNVSVIVLCGGQGTRMGELGRQHQKTLLPVWGTPLLEHVVTQLRATITSRSARILLLTGHRGEEVDALAPRWRHVDPRIRAVPEHAPGNAGVERLASALPPPVLIVAGNVLLDYTNLVPRMVATWLSDGRPVVAGSANWRTTAHHTFNVHDTTVMSWHRAPNRDAGRYEVVDTYLLTPRILAAMRAQSLSHTRALAQCVAGGTVAFCDVVGDWLHVETPADLDVHASRKDSLCPPLQPP